VDAFDHTTDPYYLGLRVEDLTEVINELQARARTTTEQLNLANAPEWPAFEALIRSRVGDVVAAMGQAREWDTVCRLQGEKRVYEWLLGFREAKTTELEAIIEMLQGYQERMEEQT
jgi:hypothetical protein